jgi:hypothetical protein
MSKILPWHNGVRADSVDSDIWFDVPVHFTQGAFGVGTTYFVSPTGLNTNGKSLEHAFTTLAAAVAVAVAGDLILVKPGTYAENVVITTDYLTVVGINDGYGRPDVAPASGLALTVTAQGFVCARMRFAATGTDAVKQEGNGFRYTDCVFDGDGTADKAGLRLQGDDADDSFTASEGVVTGCLFRGCAVGLIFDTGAAPANGVGCTHDVIEKCRFIDNTVDIATKDTGGGVYSVQDTLVSGCYFLDKNKAVYVDLTTANGGAASDQTGMFANCFFAADDITTTRVAYVGTGFALVACYSTVAVDDTSGLD